MLHKGKILIIDDNEDVLFALNLLLEPFVESIRVSADPTKIPRYIELQRPATLSAALQLREEMQIKRLSCWE